MRAITFKLCPAMLAFSLLIVPLVFSPCPPAFASEVVGWGGQKLPNAPLTNLTKIAAGGEHNLALKSDGSIVGWGGIAMVR
jgi:hypothetical protein